MEIARRGTGERLPGGNPRWRVLLLETNRDHAELISEALGESLPEIEVRVPGEESEPEAGGADLVIVGEGVPPDLIRHVCRGDLRLPLLRISSRGRSEERSGPSDGPSPPLLNKRDGLSFLTRLSQTVERILRGSGGEQARGEGPADGLYLGERALLDSLTDGLIRELSAAAAPLARWVDPAAKGGGSRPELGLELPGLRRRLAFLHALLDRLEAIRGSSAARPRSARIVLDAWLRLRRPAWGRGRQQKGAVAIAPRRSPPRVRVVPSLLGPLLDRIVERGLEQCAAGGVVRLGTGAASYSPEEERPRGLPPGRYERLSVVVTPSGGSPSPPLPRLLVDAGIAAAKAGGGFFYADSRGGGEFLFPWEAPAAPLRAPGDPDPSVLIIEGEPAVRQESSSLLEKAGYRVVTASDWRQAITLYQAGCRYPLVIAGSESGSEGENPLLSGLRFFDPAPLVIAGFSESDTQDALRDLLDHGALGLIPRPYRDKDLIAAARAALGPVGN